MRKRKVVLTHDANADLDQVGEFVSGIYCEEVGIRFVKRMFLEIIPLGISADSFPLSRFRTAREIHPEAKTIPIMKHRWTVIFHIEGDYVIVDRIFPSSSMAE